MIFEEDIPVYDIIFEEKDIRSKDDKNGLVGVAVVESPAIQLPFIALSDNRKLVHFNNSKQILTAPILVPEQLIYRVEEDLGEFYIRYTREAIENIAKHQAIHGTLKNVNIEHTRKKIRAGVYELWLNEDKNIDKSYKLFNKAFPVGTYFLSLYIPDKKTYNFLVENKTGFSIEGYFNLGLQNFKQNFAIEQTSTIKKINNNVNNKLSIIDMNIFNFGKKKINQVTATAYYAQSETGEEFVILIDETGGVFIADGSGSPLADGNYTIMNIYTGETMNISVVSGKMEEGETEVASDTETEAEQSSTNEEIITEQKDMNKENEELKSLLSEMKTQMEEMKNELSTLRKQPIKKSNIEQKVDRAEVAIGLSEMIKMNSQTHEDRSVQGGVKANMIYKRLAALREANKEYDKGLNVYEQQ